MSYKPYPEQARAHKAFLVDGFKRGVLYWSRRTGKTLWSIQQLMWSCMLHQGPHHIVFKEYQHAETVAWNQYMHLIPPEIIRSMNKSTLTVEFHHFKGSVEFPWGVQELEPDESKPPSSIRLLGSDKADSHRGGESHGMIFDEYQDQEEYGWDYVYQPMLLTTDGWACFMGTAKDKESWETLLQKAEEEPEWYYSKATWRSNPKVLKLENETGLMTRLKKEAERDGKLGSFMQEHELIPFSQQGAVYANFSRKIHVIPPEEVPEEGTDYVSVDFGYTEDHPMAIAFIRITQDDVWYQYDEIYGPGMHVDESLIGEILAKLGGRRLAGMVCDDARVDLLEFLASKGLPVIPSPKHSSGTSRIVSGIGLFRNRLKPKIQLFGDPKPNYFVTSNCKNTIYEFKRYRYKEPPKEDDKVSSVLPINMMDALRYLELFFKFGHPKDEKIPDSTMLKDLYM